jgi:hypothetical protein
MKWEEVTEEANENLRKTLGKYCDKKIVGVEPLKKIMLVGAVPEYETVSAKNGFIFEDDFKYLEITLKKLRDAGVPISPDFQVDVVNKLEERDFLAEKGKADLIVLCNLPSDPNGAELYWDPTIEAFKNEWQDRISKTGAKVVATLGVNDEHSFSYKNIESGNLQNVSHSRAKIDMSLITPIFTHSILMTPQYISEISEHLNKETEIGKNALYKKDFDENLQIPKKTTGSGGYAEKILSESRSPRFHE